jgi:hypothetical protein
VAEFDTAELRSFAPEAYIDALKGAAKEGFPVVIIDSLSHAWMGKGGLLDQADAKGGRFDAWKGLTPQQHQLIEAILAYPGHVIATMRSKTEYVVSKDDRGKTSVERVGLAPVQKDGTEYEFDAVLLMDQENTAHVIKSRCHALRGDIRKPGESLGKLLLSWLSDGAPQAPASEPKVSEKAESAPPPVHEEPAFDWDKFQMEACAGFAAVSDASLLKELAARVAQRSPPKKQRDAIAKAYREAQARIIGASGAPAHGQ